MSACYTRPMECGFTLTTNHLGQLVLIRPGEDDVVDVRPRQAFPWSAGGQMVSLRNSSGKEVVLVENLSDLPEAVRSQIEQWMAANSFLPKIERIHSVNNDFGYWRWDVETDRGAAKFRVQEREDVRFLPDGRFSIKDTDGNIYVLAPLEQLDPDSRRAVGGVL